MDPRVVYVIRTIGNDLRRPTRLNDVAHALKLSESRLEHLLKRETGRTWKQLLMEARLEKARGFLPEFGPSIKEIAFSVGYNSTSSLCRAFTRRYGISPSRLRKCLQDDVQQTGLTNSRSG